MAARKFYFEHCLLTEVRFGQNRNIFGPYLTDTAVCTCSQIPPIFANTSYSMILYRHSTFVFFYFTARVLRYYLTKDRNSLYTG